MIKKRVRFSEGQWFGVPLRTGGYAIGIVARGDNKSICLGYFFGPKYQQIPDALDTMEKDPKDAILVTRFGDLGITRGSWPLINSNRPFSRENWPIPKFGMKISPTFDKGFLRQLEFDERGRWNLLHETLVDLKEIENLPEDSMMGGGAVEIHLTKLLDC
jgi:hypothetical protein